MILLSFAVGQLLAKDLPDGLRSILVLDFHDLLLLLLYISRRLIDIRLEFRQVIVIFKVKTLLDSPVRELVEKNHSFAIGVTLSESSLRVSHIDPPTLH